MKNFAWVFFTDIHVTPGNAQDSLFRIAVAEANASDADLTTRRLAQKQPSFKECVTAH